MRWVRFFLVVGTLLLVTFSSAHAVGCRGCGCVPYPSNTGYNTPNPIILSPLVWSFESEPGLHPMKISVNLHEPGTSSGFVFLAPYGFSEAAMYGQSGALILDNEGNPIWFRPLNSPNLMNTDFRLQHYKEKPVLTFWQGTLATPPAYTNTPAGSSEPGSCYYILDHHYEAIKTVRAKLGLTSDIHEFLLTPQNSALLLSTKAIAMDLTPYGGPQNGFVQDFAVQEIDLETNELLFFWDALDHIPLTDSYEPASSASSSSNIWDAFHLNSIGLTESLDDIVVSGRNVWTIYRIHKPTGNIVWRLGGKESDFTIESGAAFSWQHDARSLSSNLVSMFDDNSDGSTTGGPPSHGLILQLDLEAMTASPFRTYFHDPNITVASQGNLQSLDNGNKFIGWGQSQYYSEFTGAGNRLYDAQMPPDNYSYRAYRNSWKGCPKYRPKIAVKCHCSHAFLYASWNGSTETKAWKVYAGDSPKKLRHVATVPKSGFETTIRVMQKGPYFQVKALNCDEKVIGLSKVIKCTN